ncbi:hypothetical protein [Phenylobacterium sp.]|jgi:hypothetical protein|uniref:hypothetical protein n=1 Tax=Phenylobacterium sp. TaxID=1871053 RepID=UPI002E33FBF0|nr:hypothetical protein [Phenylobacterium sp.]HEX4712908.1 hypothetical protein [Phenylobacterium sp.]
MAPLAIALLLFLQAQPAAEPPPASAEAASAQHRPAGAPQDDYQFVAWCYGALRGYLDLHDQVMPEVTRIESTYRAPGHKLADDLKVYAEIQKDGQRQLKVFQAALTAAEKASIRPINVIGAGAVQKGRSVWDAGPEVTKARLAQEWMSWALPARCETTAKALEASATLLGASLKANVEPEGAPPAPPPEQPAAPSPN